MLGARGQVERRTVLTKLWPRCTSLSVLLTQFRHPNSEPGSAPRQMKTAKTRAVFWRSLFLFFFFLLSPQTAWGGRRAQASGRAGVKLLGSGGCCPTSSLPAGGLAGSKFNSPWGKVENIKHSIFLTVRTVSAFPSSQGSWNC